MIKNEFNYRPKILNLQLITKTCNYECDYCLKRNSNYFIVNKPIDVSDELLRQIDLIIKNYNHTENYMYAHFHNITDPVTLPIKKILTQMNNSAQEINKNIFVNIVTAFFKDNFIENNKFIDDLLYIHSMFTNVIIKSIDLHLFPHQNEFIIEYYDKLKDYFPIKIHSNDDDFSSKEEIEEYKKKYSSYGLEIVPTFYRNPEKDKDKDFFIYDKPITDKFNYQKIGLLYKNNTEDIFLHFTCHCGVKKCERDKTSIKLNDNDNVLNYINIDEDCKYKEQFLNVPLRRRIVLMK